MGGTETDKASELKEYNVGESNDPKSKDFISKKPSTIMTKGKQKGLNLHASHTDFRTMRNEALKTESNVQLEKYSAFDGQLDRSAYVTSTQRGARGHQSLRTKPSSNLDAILSSRVRFGPTMTEPDHNAFSEEKVDMVLRIKGFNTVQDDGINFMVGEYEAMPKGAENFEENISTVGVHLIDQGDKAAGDHEGSAERKQEEPVALEVNDVNEIRSYGEGGICSICFTFEPDSVYMNCGHGGTI